MIIESVEWAGSISHIVNQEFPHRTLCGRWIPETASPTRTLSEVGADATDEPPDCLTCREAVMKS